METESTANSERAPLTLIRSFPDLPMEKVYSRQKEMGPPQVFMRNHGKGRVIYFPWDIDRTFWDVLCLDHGKLLMNAVEWVTQEKPIVTVSGPGLLDVTVWQQQHSMTVHLVNLTNPMTMKGPYRELLPVGEQEIRISIPEGFKAIKATLLAANKSIKPDRSQRELRIAVPSILDHEILAIDLG